MKKITLTCLIFSILHINVLYAQNYTAIPDTSFEKALIEQGIDNVRDGRVLTSNIESLTYLFVISENISDLTGIQDFTALQTLYCSYNQLTSINLNNNRNLRTLDCSSNQLSNLNLTNNTSLINLVCAFNQLAALNLTANTALLTLNCSDNKLTNLDVSHNILLKQLTIASNQLTDIDISNLDSLTLLSCSNNQLTALNISNNINLKNLFCASNQIENIVLSSNDSLSLLDCSNNQIKNIDISNNLFLKYLTCSSNQLEEIDLSQNDSLLIVDMGNNQLKEIDISHNDSLISLICPSNQLNRIQTGSIDVLEKIDLSYNLLDSLNLSNNPSLKSINCSNNLLNYLNINNDNNSLVEQFNATRNPYLRCILVDNPAYADSNDTWEKDSIASYNSSCAVYTYVPDDNFEAALIDLGYDSGSLDNYVLTANISNITILDIDSLNINDLTGIEDFINLDSLDCSHNQLYNLDISNLANLVKLDCSSDSLVDLNLSGVISSLVYLDAQDNPKLTCIQVDDVSAAEGQDDWLKDTDAHYRLNCLDNKTYIPDDHFEAVLIELGYDQGNLDNYVVTDSINTITRLDISKRNIFDLTGLAAFEALDTLDCSDNKLDSIDVSANTNLIFLNCSGNYLTELDVQADTLLVSLSCANNKLSAINLSSNIALQQLNCNGNFVKDIVLDADTNLQALNVNSNYLTNLDISNNTRLKKLYCANNKLTTIDLSASDSLQVLDCAHNSINTLNLQNTGDLESLDCSVNKLSSLNLSQDTALLSVRCNSNQISSLNFDDNRYIRILDCSNNKLSSINLQYNDSIRQLNASNNDLAQISVSNMSYLDSLNVTDNQLTNLNLSNSDSLRYLLCSNNQLQNLDISHNLRIRTLKCARNQLTNLTLNNNTELAELHCSDNIIESLDLSSATNLNELIIDKNKLETLDLDANTLLTKVSCSNNKITALYFSTLTHLVSMNCTSNQLSSLNARNGTNTILEIFYASNNPNLKCIEIDDENYTGTSWIKDSITSYSENCHYNETYVPDDQFEAALSVIIGEPVNNNDNYIPTDSIKSIISLNISNRNISDLTGLQDFESLTTLNCSGNEIDSLNLDFLSTLINLNCSNNQIDTIDLSKLNALEILDFSYNLIDTIRVDNLSALATLNASHNAIAYVDLRLNTNLAAVNLASNQLNTLQVNNGNNAILTNFDASGNPGLFCIEVDDPVSAENASGPYALWLADEQVSFAYNCHYTETYVPDDAFEQALKLMGYDNPSEPLDDYVPTAKIKHVNYLSLANKGIADLTGIEDFAALATLNCSNNNLTILDLSNNAALVTLICAGNQLASLNVSLNTLLNKLDATNNLLTNIDVTGNAALERLLCASNQLSSLNILSNTALIEVDCSSNQLISVDANNGFNSTLHYFDLRNNPNLRCILVDDINAATGYSGWHKDEQASYKLVCDDDDNDGIPDSEDQCPETPFGDFVDVFGCSLFVLPAGNFTILTKSETCRDGNNGKVYITATALYDYTVTLTGTLDTIISDFTNDIEIRNLRADTYALCITIEDKPGFSQCYTVTITQPDDLNVKSEMDQSGKSVKLKMTGGNVYHIDFNGHQFSTTEAEIKLNLVNGKNSVQITTDAPCQGIYHETFILSDGPSAYPNPFTDQLFLYVGENNFDRADVKIYSYSGQLVLSGSYQTDNGLIVINTSDFKSGIYYAQIKSGAQESIIKVVKE